MTRRGWPPLFAAALAGAVVACADDARMGDQHPLAPSERPSLAIQDARNSGAPGFFFLPPIQASLATYPGTFDAARSPVVAICRWSGSGCVGANVASYAIGTGVTVDAANQLYRADWPIAGLTVGTLYRIRVRQGTMTLGIADAKIPGAGETPAGLTAQAIVPLGNASKLAIRFRIANVQSGAPAVTISAPVDGAVVNPGNPDYARATAIDPEQGSIAGEIVWTSSRLAAAAGTGPTIRTDLLPGGRQTLTASATDAGGVAGSASIQIVRSIVTLPRTFDVLPANTGHLPVTLTQPAPAGGLTLAVTTSDPSIVGIEPGSQSITIPGGSTTGSVALRALAPGTARVTVSNPDWGTASSDVSSQLHLAIAPAIVQIQIGHSVPVVISLVSQGLDVPAPAGGVTVTLVPSNPGCFSAPTSVIIPAGKTYTTATLHTLVSWPGDPACFSDISMSLQASAPGVAPGSNSIGVTSSPPSAIVPPAVGSGLMTTLNVGGGMAASLDPTVLRVSPDDFTAGTTSASASQYGTIWLHAVEGHTGTVGLIVTAGGGATAVVQVPIVTPALDLSQTLAGSTNCPGAITDVSGLIGVQTSPYSFDAQWVRVGYSMTVTLAVGTPSVADLLFQGSPAASGTVVLPGRAGSIPQGVQARFLSPGQTTLTASAPGVMPSVVTLMTVDCSGLR